MNVNTHKIMHKSLLTGNIGGGKPITESIANAWVKHEDSKYAGIMKHIAVNKYTTNKNAAKMLDKLA